jgi:transcriptional regulator with XRE-family HTH domain
MQKEFELYRKMKNLTKREFSNMLGVAQNTYNYWLAGEKKPRTRFMANLQAFYDANIKGKVESRDSTEPTLKERKKEKRTLYDMMDLLSELKDGNTVYLTDTPYSLKIVDGFIVRYNGDVIVSIGSPVLASDKYHVYKPIPLNVQIGKRYLTANGEKVTIYRQGDDGIFKGIFDHTGNENFYDSNGVVRAIGGSYEDNLIEEI